MAIFHFEIRPVKRSLGHQATGSAAYRAGEAIKDERTGDFHDHTHRKDVRHAEIMLPSQYEGLPMEWARNRSTLWNKAEATERTRKSRVAREYEATLPAELSPEQRLALARSFGREIADRYGVAVDLAIHDPKPGRESTNYHAHFLTTTREVAPTGLGPKTGLDMNAVSRAKQGLSHHSEEYYFLRQRWATVTNEALRDANIDAKVDHRSLAAQGVDRQPLVTIPMEFYALERQGIPKEIAERLREDYRARVVAYRERTAGAQAQAAAPAKESATQPPAAAPGSEPAAQPLPAIGREQSAAPPTESPAQSKSVAPMKEPAAPTRSSTPAQSRAPAKDSAPQPTQPLSPSKRAEQTRRRAVQEWLQMRSKEAQSSQHETRDNRTDADRASATQRASEAQRANEAAPGRGPQGANASHSADAERGPGATGETGPRQNSDASRGSVPARDATAARDTNTAHEPEDRGL